MKTKSRDDFFKAIKKDGNLNRFAFLLGNGFLRYMRTIPDSWNHLAEACCKEFSQKEDPFIPSSGLSNPELFNLLEFHSEAQSEDKETRMRWKKKINDFLNNALNQPAEKISCELLKYAWHNTHLLTTNFDNFLEEQIRKIAGKPLHQCQVNLQNDATRNNNHASYRWSIFYSVMEPRKIDISPLKLKNDLWHIHGKLDHRSSSSVLFSLTRYIHAIKRVENWGLASNKDWGGENTWVNIFYNCPLIIAGLGLTAQEIFLRTLLIERKRHWRRIHKSNTAINEPDSYYLVSKTSPAEQDGRDFLSALGFHIVEFETFDDLYNNENWNTKENAK